MMCKSKAIYRIILACSIFISCQTQNKPDLSGIKLNVVMERFDEAMFASKGAHTKAADHAKAIDHPKPVDSHATNNNHAGTHVNHTEAEVLLEDLQRSFPGFTQDFITYILHLAPPGAPLTQESLASFQLFLDVYKPVYDSLKTSRAALKQATAELTTAFKYFTYYFPDFKAPKVVSYVGPFDAPGIALTTNALAIGLQLYGGKNFFFYQTPEGKELFPNYISRKFEPAYISINATTALINDHFPQLEPKGALIDQIVICGKHWYLLHAMMPDKADTLLTGLTQTQYKFSTENEGNIWNYLLKNTDIYTSEPTLIRQYIGNAPNTPGLPDAAPGNLGQFLGFKIVQKYMAKFPETTLQQLVQLDNRTLFQDAGYKPR